MIKSLLQKSDDDEKVTTGTAPVLSMNNPEVDQLQEKEDLSIPVVSAVPKPPEEPVEEMVTEDPVVAEEPMVSEEPTVAEEPMEPMEPTVSAEPVLSPAERENSLASDMDQKSISAEIKRRASGITDRQDALIAERKKAEDLKFSIELETLLNKDPTRSTADEEYSSLSVQTKLGALEALEGAPALASVPVMIMRSLEDKISGTETNYADQLISFLGILSPGNPLEGSKVLADRIISGQNVDSIFDLKTQQKLESKYGVKVSQDTLENTAVVRAIATTLITLNANSLIKVGTKTLNEVGIGTLKEGAEQVVDRTKKQIVGDAAKLQTKAAVVTGASVVVTQDVVKAIDPKSIEDAFLLSLVTGVTSGVILTPTVNVASSFIGYTPTAMVLKAGKKGTRAIINGANFLSDAMKMKSEADRRGMKFSEVSEEWYQKSEGSKYMNDFLNRVKDEPDNARAEVEQVLQKARENPGGVEHQAATALYTKLSEDGINIDKATNLAASLTESLLGTGLSISAFDTYNGIFKSNFMELYNVIDPQAHLKRWESQIELLQKSIEIEEFASPDDIRTITNAATLLTSNITKIKNTIDKEQSLALQENLNTLTDKLLSDLGTDLSGNQDKRITASYEKLRSTMQDIKKTGQSVKDAMYAAVDPAGKLKTSKALSSLNDMMNATVRSAGDYKVSKDLYNSSIFSYLDGVLDNPNGVIPDIVNRDKQPVQDPNSMFSDNAIGNTEGRIVFMSVNQFQKLTKGLESDETAAASALVETPDTKFTNVPGLSLDMVDGILSITGSVGRSEAQAARLISSKSKGNTLIPVELKTSAMVNVETLIKTGAVDIRGEGNKTTGNFAKVRLKGQIEERNIQAQIKRAEVEAIAEYARTKGFDEQGGLNRESGVLKLEEMQLSYRQAREIQKTLRTKARKASDPILQQALSDKAVEFDAIMDQLVASDTQASLAFYTAQEMYRDSYVPDFLNTTQGIIGKFTSFTKDGVESQLMSEAYKQVLTSPELRSQLVDMTDPQRFSIFNELVTTREGQGKLAYLNDLLSNGTKDQLSRLPKNGKDLRTLVSGILLDDILTTYRNKSNSTDVINSGELLYSVVRDKMTNPLFKTMVEADPELSAIFKQLEDTAIDPASYLPAIAELQSKAAKYDNIFYNNIENLRKGNTIPSILKIIKDPQQLAIAMANMMTQGNALAGSREFMISTVYREALKWKDGVLDVKRLERTLETYGPGLDVLSSSTKDRKNLEIILQTTKAIGNRPDVTASLDLKRFSGFIGTILAEGPPAVSNYFHAQKMGLNTGYIAAARAAAFAKKRIIAMEAEFTKLTTSLAIETMLNPSLFKELKAISELNKSHPPELVRASWQTFEMKLRGVATEGAKQSANSLRIIKNLSQSGDLDELNAILEELKGTGDPEQEEKEIKESLGIYDMDEFRSLMGEEVIEQPEVTEDTPAVSPSLPAEATMSEEAMKIQVFKDKGIDKQGALEILASLGLLDSNNERMYSIIDEAYDERN
jgi:hypothetical protein